MGGLDGFAFTFLNLKVMAEWLPKIAAGFVLTVVLAALTNTTVSWRQCSSR